MFKSLLRIVAYLLAILALILGVLWVVGGQTFINIAEVTIAAPAERVFDFLSEDDKVKQWMKGVAEIKPLEPGERKVGAKARIVVEEDGHRLEMQDEVLRLEPGRLLEVRITHDMFAITSLYELSETGGQTHLKHTMRADYQSLGRVAAPLLSGEIQHKLESDFQRLKQLAEAK